MSGYIFSNSMQHMPLRNDYQPNTWGGAVFITSIANIGFLLLIQVEYKLLKNLRETKILLFTDRVNFIAICPLTQHIYNGPVATKSSFLQFPLLQMCIYQLQELAQLIFFSGYATTLRFKIIAEDWVVSFHVAQYDLQCYGGKNQLQKY